MAQACACLRHHRMNELWRLRWIGTLSQTPDLENVATTSSRCQQNSSSSSTWTAPRPIHASLYDSRRVVTVYYKQVNTAHRRSNCADHTCKRRNFFEFAQPGFQFAHSGFNKMGGQRPSYDYLNKSLTESTLLPPLLLCVAPAYAFVCIIISNHNILAVTAELRADQEFDIVAIIASISLVQNHRRVGRWSERNLQSRRPGQLV